MQLTLTIPDELTETLRQAYGSDLARSALEQLALGWYRTGKLSRYELQRLLGFTSRFEIESWLGKMGEYETYSVDDLIADGAKLNDVVPLRSTP
jgi:DNA polymerase III delta subunit